MKYLLLLLGNNGNSNTPYCFITCCTYIVILSEAKRGNNRVNK